MPASEEVSRYAAPSFTAPESVVGAADRAYKGAILSPRELMDIADAGQLMPPKSTWFEPTLLSGLFIHKLK